MRKLGDYLFQFVEAINNLKNVQSMQPLKWSEELTAACEEHVEDLVMRRGGMTHKGSDGRSY